MQKKPIFRRISLGFGLGVSPLATLDERGGWSGSGSSGDLKRKEARGMAAEACSPTWSTWLCGVAPLARGGGRRGAGRWCWSTPADWRGWGCCGCPVAGWRAGGGYRCWSSTAGWRGGCCGCPATGWRGALCSDLPSGTCSWWRWESKGGGTDRAAASCLGGECPTFRAGWGDGGWWHWDRRTSRAAGL